MLNLSEIVAKLDAFSEIYKNLAQTAVKKPENMLLILKHLSQQRGSRQDQEIKKFLRHS